YHDAFEDNQGNVIAYAVLPYQGPAPDGSTGPDGANAALGAEAQYFTGIANPLTELQDLTGVASHEVAEAITDPIPYQNFYGWLDSVDPPGGLQPGGYEIGDLANAELSTYHGYVMQDLPGRTAADLANQQGGASAIASATGPITRPLDTDLFIDQVDNPTAGAFNGTIATFTDKDAAVEPAGIFTVAINWSDGTASNSQDGTGHVTVVSNGDGTFNVLGQHTYPNSPGRRYGSNAFNFDGLQVLVIHRTNGETAWNKPPVTLVATEPADVTSMASTTASGTYGTGAGIGLTLDFNEAVNVTGVPTLALNSGGTASYTSGSGTDQLVFTYTVGFGETTAGASLDAASANALTGIITDTLGNAASRTVPIDVQPNSLPGSKSIIINGGSKATPSVPTVTGITPNSGPTAGGTPVTITGTGFTASSAVLFGSVPATDVQFVSAASLIAVAPAEAAGTVDVTVTTADGTSAASAGDQFTFVSALLVSGFPTSTFAGAQHNVTITALDANGHVLTGFTGPVQLGSSDAGAVLPGTVQLTNGLGSVPVTFTTPGLQSISTSAGTLSSSESGIIVDNTSNYALVSTTVDANNNTVLLWDHPDGSAVVWTVDNGFNLLHVNAFAEAGWTATKIAAGSDGLTRLLWVNNSNQSIALWLLNSDGTVNSTSGILGVAGWTPMDLSVGAATRLLWFNSSSGQAAVWTMDNSFNVLNSVVFGPISGWSVRALGVGAADLPWMLWDNGGSGQAALWELNSDNTFNQGLGFSTSPGWTAVGVTVGSDGNPRLLWDHADGHSAVWTISSTNPIGVLYGPFSGFTAVALAGGSDGLTRLIWTNSNGVQVLWLLNADDSFNSAGTFGPFS
ncbi:MAG: IPT/TIG domain-containing protein, partial [Planctomycetes bacterium]|nr:IPT/TIG domain-containing protein [Planctomycetota bacterium]